jgi:hypothetical protein
MRAWRRFPVASPLDNKLGSFGGSDDDASEHEGSDGSGSDGEASVDGRSTAGSGLLGMCGQLSYMGGGGASLKRENQCMSTRTTDRLLNVLCRQASVAVALRSATCCC